MTKSKKFEKTSKVRIGILEGLWKEQIGHLPMSVWS